jgi:hypothetical protein
MKVWQFYLAHQTAFALGGYYLASAFVGSLPMPDDKSSTFYHWFFTFANTLAANLSRVNAHLAQDKAAPPKV